MAYFEENPQGISQADMIIAIPSFNEAEMIGYVTSQASQGLTEHFGHLKSVLINCDNHSDDGTKEAFMSVPDRAFRAPQECLDQLRQSFR